jgi:hypothetical protein
MNQAANPEATDGAQDLSAIPSPDAQPTPAKNPNRGDENLACYAFAKSQDAKMQDFIAKLSANQKKDP